jgi:hypothetical protein
MRPKFGSVVGMHRLRKSTPNKGVSAYLIFQQKVAATAFAASNGIQYPDRLVRTGHGYRVEMWDGQFSYPVLLMRPQ